MFCNLKWTFECNCKYYRRYRKQIPDSARIHTSFELNNICILRRTSSTEFLWTIFFASSSKDPNETLPRTHRASAGMLSLLSKSHANYAHVSSIHSINMCIHTYSNSRLPLVIHAMLDLKSMIHFTALHTHTYAHIWAMLESAFTFLIYDAKLSTN